jgi:hypothetical protein
MIQVNALDGIVNFVREGLHFNQPQNDPLQMVRELSYG